MPKDRYFGRNIRSTCSFSLSIGSYCASSEYSGSAVTHNFLIQETSLGIHYNEGVELTDYLMNHDVFALEAGFIRLPKGPGLGIQIDEAAVKEASCRWKDWSNPLWRHEDGPVTGW